MANVNPQVNEVALKSDIRAAIITKKANACPMAVRLAWHAAGTYDIHSKTGGSDGATMRFEPESTDAANAGLSIMRDMLLPVSKKNPDISVADVWTFAGATAVELTGGPKVPHTFCRKDAANGSYCPPNGRLPDASQGAAHLREVFYRMGFNDQEIVALSGAHTLGRCHLSRSGFDGPWTRHPLKFDNQYFKNLVELEWTPRKWEGNFQYEDPSGELMMLPTDLALKTDPEFRKYVDIYAADQQRFFDDFAAAFGKLLAAGTKHEKDHVSDERDVASAHFREAAMHGSLDHCKKYAEKADVHQVEASSGRTALHKAAFWGHDATVKFLVEECKLDLNTQDYNGDTALHDAARFGHKGVVSYLLAAGTDATIKNRDGKCAVAVANDYDKPEIAALIQNRTHAH